ncbi:hypothetical protein B2I21_31725 [Chryseobacterium mucoviscidosis]|uniref:hypothetical protein n=1 Tax=unclassified Paenibacillus TaxID=185978 RepID=UPI0009A3A247|nr:hypothetical protein B2I21_31725 [Chryseobacterium mucoviscidosis]
MSPGRRKLNKVSQVTIFFGIIKILATTVGETAADLLNQNLNLGLTVTTLLMTVLLIGAMATSVGETTQTSLLVNEI